jgi:hypothetical protein
LNSGEVKGFVLRGQPPFRDDPVWRGRSKSALKEEMMNRKWVILLLLVLLTACGGSEIWDGDNPGENRQPPIARAGFNLIVIPGTTVTLDASGSFDPGDEDLSFTWEQISGAPVTLSANDVAVVTFVAPDILEPLVFRVTVSNGKVSTADQVIIR